MDRQPSAVSRVVSFVKMHGAGNDVVVIDDRDGRFPAHDAAWLAALAARRTGIGCEGIMLVQTAQDGGLGLRFFNTDGHEAAFCGNATRCAVRFALDRGMTGSPMVLHSGAGTITAGIVPDGVRLGMPPARGLTPALTLEGETWAMGFVNSGVPHVVIDSAADLDGLDVATVGRRIRRHPRFAPDGANVTFTRVTGPGRLNVRTYERGLEAESGACGTGAVAAALVMAARGRVTPPVTLTTRHGFELTVAFALHDGRPDTITLTGPAETVYEGRVVYRGAAA